MLHSADISLNQSALLVVDAQDSFKATQRWESRNNHNFEANVGALISAYRNAGLPIFYFLHTDGDEGFATDSPYFKLMDFIEPRDDEHVIVKDTRNCFTSTNLQSFLLKDDIRRLAITGIQMEQCCETTARIAADLGYAVDFVIDGTITFPITNPNAPNDVLGVDAISERTIFVLRDRFAQILETQDLVTALDELHLSAAKQ